MANVGIAGAAVTLLLFLGRVFITHVGAQVTRADMNSDAAIAQLRVDHAEELARLERSWEARLADARREAGAWEATAAQLQRANAENTAQVGALLRITETVEAIVRAIREGQTGR